MADLSPSIGTIDGIKVELHWTFLILLLFILFISLYLFVVWVLLFACVLIHELVHSITSKRNGVKVKKIVLYPFGGGSIIDFSEIKPDVEFKISIVGPIASFLIGAVVGIITILTPAGIVKSTLQILFLLNIFLGAFNMLPWLPLDGGRALRSYLQKKRGFLDATRLAVKSSNIITALFVIGTVAYVLYFANSYSVSYKEFLVLFDIVIAFFIYGGAQNELQSAVIREGISDLRADDATTKSYIVLSGSARIGELYRTVMKRRMHIILFKQGSRIKMLSTSSLQKLLKRDAHNGKIEDFGVEIPSVQHDSSLYSAMERMRSDEKNIAAVMKGKSITGVLMMQHIESVIALHMSQNGKIAVRQTNK